MKERNGQISLLWLSMEMATYRTIKQWRSRLRKESSIKLHISQKNYSLNSQTLELLQSYKCTLCMGISVGAIDNKQ